MIFVHADVSGQSGLEFGRVETTFPVFAYHSSPIPQVGAHEILHGVIVQTGRERDPIGSAFGCFGDFVRGGAEFFPGAWRVIRIKTGLPEEILSIIKRSCFDTDRRCPPVAA